MSPVRRTNRADKDVESSAEPWSAEEPQTRVAENDNGTGSVWQWDGSEKIRVQLGDETADYTLNADKTLTSDNQLYWTSTAPATVTAWYPTNETVDLSDQSNSLAYVLKAEVLGATYDNKIALNFTHKLAKVRVVLSGTGNLWHHCLQPPGRLVGLRSKQYRLDKDEETDLRRRHRVLGGQRSR